MDPTVSSMCSDRPVHVVVAHPYAWPDVRRGGERYAADLVGYLRGHGHVVTSIAGTRSRAVASGGDDVRLRHLPSIERGRVRVLPPDTFGVRAWPSLVRHRADVVHALVPSAVLAARHAGHRVLFTLLGNPTDEALAGRPQQERLLRAAIRAATEVAALSTPVADQVERRFGRRPVVLAPGVSSARFAPRPRTERPTILFASALVPEKGLDVLVAALGPIRQRHPDASLVLAGPGTPPDDIDHPAIVVHGQGREEDVPRLMAESHVTVLPSRNEAFGLVLAESLMSGTPVVGTTTGGAADIIEPAVGRCVPFGSVAALADAVGDCLELARDPALAARCRSRARLWGWDETIGPAHVGLYERVEAAGRTEPG
jgi:phosphatidylinositol alpha-mannosyltransferase